MKTSYKFWYVKKEDDIHINEVAVRFYEGDITTENERIDIEGTIAPITRYRRSKRLQKTDLAHLSDKPVRKELTGDDCMIFTDKDFGVTDNLDDVRNYLNSILLKDTKREAITEQSTVDKAKLLSVKNEII